MNDRSQNSSSKQFKTYSTKTRAYAARRGREIKNTSDVLGSFIPTEFFGDLEIPRGSSDIHNIREAVTIANPYGVNICHFSIKYSLFQECHIPHR